MPVSGATPVRPPRISVVVATYQGAERIGTCLSSLTAQSLHSSQFEIIVVQNGPRCETPAVVGRVREEQPHHTIRLFESREPGAGRARNLGIDAARGAYVTFVDDDDWVSRDYLAALLESAAPGVIPVAYLADVPDGTQPGEAAPDFDNYLSRGLLRMSGRTVPPTRISRALSANACKLVPTSLARAVRYDETLSSGEDFVFWIGVHARSAFDVRVVPRERGAVYYRSLRSTSVSRRELGYDFNVLQRLDCIAALDRIDSEQDLPTAKLARWAKEGQAQWVHQYLTEHPDSRDQIRADAEARKVSGAVPWRQVNQGMARDLAILYCFTPYSDTSALVAARRIRARGVVTDVISQQMDDLKDKDPTSLQIAHEFLDVVRFLPGRATVVGWEPTRRYAEKAARLAAELQAEKGPYRTLYSRAMAPQSHVAAAVVKLQNPDIVWTAEFSDPLLMNPYGEERVGDIGKDRVTKALSKGIRAAGFDLPDSRRLFSWAEQVAYVLADEIVFTNDHQRDFMLGYCTNRRASERAAAVSSVSRHPILPQRFYEAAQIDYPLPEDRVHVGYFGQFYLTRGLTEVTAALQALTPAERTKIRLHVFTSNPEELELEALKRGLGDVVNARSYVPFLEYLALSTRFDALLVNDAATAQHHAVNPYLPSKLADYRGSGTPIWAIHEPGSMLSAEPVDHASRLGDVDGALGVLRDLIAQGPRSSAQVSPILESSGA